MLNVLIANLDLSDVRMKLQEPEPEGKGWSKQQVEEAEKWYKRFLQVCLLGEVQPVPNQPIDTFWHQHILDTRAYVKDCQTIFGHFLHHYPYFGLKGDARERDGEFDKTNQVYHRLFGEDCSEMHGFFKKAGPCRTDGDANSCSAPCVPEACSGGGTCSACTVDGETTKRSLQPSCKSSSCTDVPCTGWFANLKATSCGSTTGTGCRQSNCGGTH